MKKRIYSMIICSIAIILINLINVNSIMADTGEKKQHVVVIDPGHGGQDAGACETFYGKTYREADMTWKIATYAQQALKRLAPDIKVYLTREQSEYVSVGGRVDRAATYNPDLLVSMHINSADTESAKGASVLISKGTYRPYLAVEELKFGKLVMSELTKLGIAMRFAATGGMEYRMTENGSTYPNGALSDYYGIVHNSVRSNFPGVIIEHAFISSYSDVSKFLSTDSKLKALGEADARAIIAYCNQIPAEGISKVLNGWVQEYDGNYYYYKNNVLQKNKLLRLDGEVYYVNGNGVRQTGWQKVQGKTFYFQKDGTAYRGWMTVGEDKYYFNSKDGFMYANRILPSASNNLYIFAADGKLCKGWTEFDNKQYYMGVNGYAVKGLKKIKGTYYYFHSKNAYMYKNALLKIGSSKNVFYFGTDGKAFTKGFKDVKGSKKTLRYFFESTGKAKKGWLKYNGKWYYFNSKDAFMYRNGTLKGGSGKIYRFDGNGVCLNKN